MRASAWTAATLVWMVVTGGACPADLSAEARQASVEARPAQTEGRRAEAEPAAGGKELHALRISMNSTSMRVDGRVDEEAWMAAPVISGLTQEDPDNRMLPTESTTVRVAYDVIRSLKPNQATQGMDPSRSQSASRRCM